MHPAVNELTELQDTIRVEPVDFGKTAEDALLQEIQRRYANKVIANVGLCLSVLDILQSSEGAVWYGDGCLYYKVTFRLIVFRPFLGELLVGRIRSSSEKGITVSVGFFDDIVVPPGLLPDYSIYDPEKNAFFWLVSTEQSEGERQRPSDKEMLESPEEERLYLERRDWVRVRVHEEHWDDPAAPGGASKPSLPQAPVPSSAPPAGANQPSNATSTVNGPPPVPGAPHVGNETGGRAPYSLVCSMSEQGTGVLDWWIGEEGAEDANGMQVA